MRSRLLAATEWFDHRTGVPTAWRHFLLEEIPDSAGWAQVFGSVALFLFMVQALTGILLAFNYAPTPGDAYDSLQYVIRNVAGGRLVHGLHHWGSSLMVVVVFLHMAQVFIYGAYKRPREATWIAGAVLLLLTLAFGLTGYLLPWDNRAYWGTVVTAQIFASVPVLGPFLTHLLGAQSGVGVLTFARFYTLHTVLLPLVIVLMIAFHIYMVRRHGITPASIGERKNQRFYPKQAFRDTVAVFAAFTMLFLAAAFLNTPLDRLADPTDTTYVPRPEWYFLFLFELLRIFKGSLEVIGTVVLPTAAVILLFLIPFVRVPRPLYSHRKLLAGAFVLAAFGIWASLTAAAIVSEPRHTGVSITDTRAAEWASISPEQIAGIGYFQAWGCANCHNLINGPRKAGPNLSAARLHHRKEWLVHHFNENRQPESHADSGSRPSLPQLNALSLFLADLKPDSAKRLQQISPQFTRGAQVYVTGACASCHKVNGAGGGIGPPLNGLFDRRAKDWVEAHFANPQKLSPGSIMPPYRFSPEDRNALMRYLAALPE